VFNTSFFLQAPYVVPTDYKDKIPVAFVGFSMWMLMELQNRMNFT
jgi:hypothetical protein